MKSWKDKILALLATYFDAREAAQVCRILFEDIVTPLKDKQDEKQIQSTIENAVFELISGKPLAYITGVCHFYGRPFRVDSHVLIPRPETEELVYSILQTLPNTSLKVLEIGSGSGCIPITLKLERPTWLMESIDISKEALQIARSNASNLGAEVDFIQEDFLKEKIWEVRSMLDLIVSNPPYIGLGEKDSMSESTLQYEPELALFAPGSDPLIFYRKLAAFGALKLKKGGYLFLELNEFKALEIDQIFREIGIYRTEILMDLQGKKRILKAMSV